ncbi:MAG: Rpp14/Pop5 family protein [Candidatus Heimdallarchaeaceae archaeon]
MIDDIRDRYIVYKTVSKEVLKLSDIKRIFWQKYQFLFGITKTTEAGLFFEEYKDGKGLLRCTQKSLKNTLITMSLISEINSIPIIMFPIYISGTIKKAKSVIEQMFRIV